MQLFLLDRDPRRAAQMICDLHLRKMCLETAQILSSVLTLQGKPLIPGMPKPYHLSHPVILAIDTPEKINWVIRYFFSLQREYYYRFRKRHAYYFLPCRYRKCLFVPGRHENDFSFARVFKEIEIKEPDLIDAYRIYYRHKKSRLHRWNYTRRSEPEWLVGNLKNTVIWKRSLKN